MNLADELISALALATEPHHGPDVREPRLVIAVRHGVPHHRRDGLPSLAVTLTDSDVAPRQFLQLTCLPLTVR